MVRIRRTWPGWRKTLSSLCWKRIRRKNPFSRTATADDPFIICNSGTTTAVIYSRANRKRNELYEPTDTAGGASPRQGRNLTTAIIVVSIAFRRRRVSHPGAQVKIDFGFNTHSCRCSMLLNSSTAILLIASLYFIRHGQVTAHKRANLPPSCSAASPHFLCDLSRFNPSTMYGDLNHDGLCSAMTKKAAGGSCDMFIIYPQQPYYFIRHHHLWCCSRCSGLSRKVRQTSPLAKDHLAGLVVCGGDGVIVYLMISKYY